MAYKVQCPLCGDSKETCDMQQEKDCSWMDDYTDDESLQIIWHNMQVPKELIPILKYIDWKCPSNTFCQMSKEDIEMFINWLGEIKHPIYYEFCTNEHRFNVIAKEVIVR